MRLFLFAWTAYFFDLIAWASSDSHHAETHIPWQALYPQFLNFGLVVILLLVFGRKKIAYFFDSRKAQYKELVVRAESAKSEAEDLKQKIWDRLTKLNESTPQNLKNAKAEAADLRRKIIQEAELLAGRLEDEASRSAEYELERAKLELKEEVLNLVLSTAEKSLATGIDGQNQKKLQNEFVCKIQVAR
ncbi:MAG: ATP synthase F0 subunit B [Bdellovibrionales bacterium]|nr:ATP synthase F0 subunit B [Bdellovibrionales bacterium]